jgi:protein tyrosine phosphatase (PTP) superfamily phosphohydrolase (DUF442 family)
MLGCLAIASTISAAPPALNTATDTTATATIDTATIENNREVQANDEFPHRQDSRFLPNLVQVHQRVLSGGQPDGADAFRELAKRGVETVISVDGVKPDVETAKLYGLRYIHLPHGYDGISKQRSMELAKALLQVDAVVYIHCHHGKHRSPAAASVACVTAGWLPPSRALSILEVAGTSPNYRGLFEVAREARPIDPRLLSELSVVYHEIADIPPMAEAMVKLDGSYARLKMIAAAQWSVPASHPDLDPAHETLLLHEHFAELLRLDEVQSRPADFASQLKESADLAQAIHDKLTDGRSSELTTQRIAELNADFQQLTARCSQCHVQYRD